MENGEWRIMVLYDNDTEDKMMFMMKLQTMMMMVFFLMAVIANLPLCLSFISLSSMNRHLPRQQRLAASSSHDFSECFVSSKQRRTILSDSVFLLPSELSLAQRLVTRQHMPLMVSYLNYLIKLRRGERSWNLFHN